MKNSIIDTIFFYDDHIDSKIKHTKERDRLFERGFEFYEKLSATLNKEQKEQLEEFIECQIGVESETSDAYFKAGLKYGMLLVFECLSN